MEPSIHHIAIAVHDLDTALAFYQDGLGLEMTERREVPEEGVEIAFLPTGHEHGCGEIELLQPLGAEGGVARFLEKHGEGLHHICLSVTDIEAAVERLRVAGAQMLSDEPRVNQHGTRYTFIHPQAAHGVLLELYEVAE
jgi:methylmalonyl-CoA epimerase